MMKKLQCRSSITGVWSLFKLVSNRNYCKVFEMAAKVRCYGNVDRLLLSDIVCEPKPEIYILRIMQRKQLIAGVKVCFSRNTNWSEVSSGFFVAFSTFYFGMSKMRNIYNINFSQCCDVYRSAIALNRKSRANNRFFSVCTAANMSFYSIYAPSPETYLAASFWLRCPLTSSKCARKKSAIYKLGNCVI